MSVNDGEKRGVRGSSVSAGAQHNHECTRGVDHVLWEGGEGAEEEEMREGERKTNEAGKKKKKRDRISYLFPSIQK
jgi:hypothetical protein